MLLQLRHDAGELVVVLIHADLSRARAVIRSDEGLHVRGAVRQVGQPLDRREVAAARLLLVAVAERGADQPRCPAGLADHVGFRQPEDEVGKADRVLGRRGKFLEQPDMVEGHDPDQADGERLFLGLAAKARCDGAQNVERGEREQAAFGIDFGRSLEAQCQPVCRGGFDCVRQLPFDDAQNRLPASRKGVDQHRAVAAFDPHRRLIEDDARARRRFQHHRVGAAASVAQLGIERQQVDLT